MGAGCAFANRRRPPQAAAPAAPLPPGGPARPYAVRWPSFPSLTAALSLARPLARGHFSEPARERAALSATSNSPARASAAHSRSVRASACSSRDYQVDGSHTDAALEGDPSQQRPRPASGAPQNPRRASPYARRERIPVRVARSTRMVPKRNSDRPSPDERRITTSSSRARKRNGRAHGGRAVAPGRTERLSCPNSPPPPAPSSQRPAGAPLPIPRGGRPVRCPGGTRRAGREAGRELAADPLAEAKRECNSEGERIEMAVSAEGDQEGGGGEVGRKCRAVARMRQAIAPES